MGFQNDRRLSGEIRQRIVASAAENSRHQPPAEAVSEALMRAALNVRAISLDDWKAVIFEAFDATRDSMVHESVNCLAAGT